MLLSVLIPVYNEEKTVADILKKVAEVKLPRGVKKEVVVVDDGSFDKTADIIKKEAKKYVTKVAIKIVNHKKNSGKGAAIRTAINHAKGDYLIVQDADLEYDPNDFIRLFDPVIDKKAQVVFGTRLINYPLRLWGEDKTVLPTHWIANKVLTKLTNVLYGSQLTDMETCYKLFSKDVLMSFSLSANRFDFEPEITAKILRNGYAIHEVPIKTKPRTHKEGKKIKWHDGVSAIWTLFKYRFIK